MFFFYMHQLGWEEEKRGEEKGRDRCEEERGGERGREEAKGAREERKKKRVCLARVIFGVNYPCVCQHANTK